MILFYYLCSENKDVDQLRSAAPLFSNMKKSRFSHDVAHMSQVVLMKLTW